MQILLESFLYCQYPTSRLLRNWQLLLADRVSTGLVKLVCYVSCWNRFYPVYSLTPTEYKTNYLGLEKFEGLDPKNHFPRMYTRALIFSHPIWHS